VPPRESKIIVFREEDLPTHNLNDAIVFCRTINEFNTTLMTNHLLTLTIVCGEDKLLDLVPSLAHLTLDIIYVLTDQVHITWPIALIDNTWKPIRSNDQKQFMRCLCLKAMLRYYKQGMQHEQNGDNGLKDLCLRDAISALNQTKQFV
jgi:hypothetical protein